MIDEGLVITPASTDGAHPAGVAVGAGADMVVFEKLAPSLVIEASVHHIAHLGDGGVYEAVTGSYVSGRANPEHSETCAACVSLADPGVQLFNRVANVGEPVLPAL